jgi:Right handed beta helix region/Secretion system C-terminal sorting domain
MKKMIIPLLIIVVFHTTNNLFAAKWYLSFNGNDNNGGTAETSPWKTISKLNTKISDGTIKSRDSILLRRGDIFEGEINLGSSLNKVYLGAWSSGTAKPIIKGSTDLTTGWTLVSGNTWSINLSTAPELVLSNSILQTPARSPNTGWFYADAVNNNTTTQLVDASIGSSGITWTTGGKVVLRTEDWLYETRSINTQSGSTITYNATNWGIEEKRPFFLFGKQAALDAAGEWFYNTSQQKLYFVAPSGLNPNSLKMEVSTRINGIKGTAVKDSIRIENLTFRGQSSSAVYIDTTFYCSNILIKNCTFINTHSGIMFRGNNSIIESDSFLNIYNRSIYFNRLEGQSKIIKNVFINVGRIPQYNYYAPAIFLEFCDGITISENKIDSCGSEGIRVNQTKNYLVEKNLVKNALLITSDGGGIYCYGAENGLIRNNFVSDIIGDLNGVKTSEAYSIGIYLDNGCNNNRVENNTVYNITSSGLLQNYLTHTDTFRGNTTYNCGRGLSFTDIDEQAQPIIYGSRVTKNVFFSLERTQIPFAIFANNSDRWYPVDYIDSNYYFNPFDFYSVIRTAPFSDYPRYTFPTWQSDNSALGEVNSKASWFYAQRRPITGTPGTELILNGSFNSTVDNWFSDGGGTLVWENNPDLTNGTAKETFSNNTADFCFASSNGFSITSGQWYNLKVQLKTTFSQDIRVILQRNGGDYAFLQYITWLPVSSLNTKSFNLSFKSDSSANVRLIFLMDKKGESIWIDEVSLKPVSVSNPTITNDYRLFTNTTNSSVNISLNNIAHKNLDNQTVSNTLTIPAWSSKILIKSSVIPAQTQNLVNKPLILDIEAKLENQKSKILWTNNFNDLDAYFILQKLNTSTQTFEDIKTINTIITNGDINRYISYDENLNEGENIYRIKLIMPNNTVVYSQNKSIIYSKDIKYSVFPNPTKDFITIRRNTKGEDTVSVTIFDILGKVVLAQDIENLTSSQIKIDFSQSIINGAYWVQIKDKTSTEITKILLTR